MKALIIMLTVLLAVSFGVPVSSASAAYSRTVEHVTQHEFNSVHTGDTRPAVTQAFGARGKIVNFWYPEQGTDRFGNTIYGWFHIKVSYLGWNGGRVTAVFSDPHDCFVYHLVRKSYTS